MDLPSQTARKVTRPEDIEPLYARILNKTTAINKKVQSKKSQKNPTTLKNPTVKESTKTTPKLDKTNSDKDSYTQPSPQKNVLISPNFKTTIINKPVQLPPTYKTTFKLDGAKLKAQSGMVSMRRVSSTAKLSQKMPTTKLYPKKNMNLKTFADFLCAEPVRLLTKNKNQFQNSDEGAIIKVLRPGKVAKTTKKKPIYRLMEEVQNSRSLKSLEYPNNLESNCTMKQVMKNIKKSGGKAQKKVITSLYAKVKLGL